MIIQLLNKIPIKIYLYIIIFAIVIFGIIGVYMFLKMSLSSFQKTIVIWYFIILEINMIHLYFILNFYSKNKTKKGVKGPKGETGARGFKGENQICSQCGDSGKKIDKYAGITNDNGQRMLDNPKVVRGKCVFPFIHNYKYHYDCTKDPTPIELKNNPTLNRSQDASIYGWCATRVDADMNVESYGFCNENKSITAKKKALLAKQNARNMYLKNNQGILDIILVDGNTSQEAKNKCLKKGTYGEWEIEDQDLNEGTGGKFIYMCVKKGTGNRGVKHILISDKEEITTETGAKTKKDIKGYEIITNENGEKLDINKDAKATSGGKSSLFMFKKRTRTNFIKDINFKPGACDSNFDPPKFYYEDKFTTGPVDINTGTDAEGTNGEGTNGEAKKFNMCISKNSVSDTSIDTAFVYKDKNLYFFRDYEFFKMNKTIVQSSISPENGYPKNMSEKWFKQSNNIGKWDAAFTYGYDKKTYFFKGDLVYKYDDKNMRLESGFPKTISRIFKGVPNGINAVFTWNKDNTTYFFKGGYYYKYNDKQKKVERGYPKLSSKRWSGMPLLINAIFSLPFNITETNKKNTTYIISGSKVFYLEATTDTLKPESGDNIDTIFKSLDKTIKKKKKKITTIDTST